MIKRKIILCKNCNKLKPHEAFGLCKSCYMKEYYKKIYNNCIGRNTYIRKIRHKSYLYYCNGKAVHRVIAEKALGRRLKKNEIVHHIDGNALNNENSNLLICTVKYHSWLHTENGDYQIGKNKYN